MVETLSSKMWGTMNTFTQHIPGFFDMNEPVKEIEFETTEDLLAIDVVKQWMEPMDGKPFSHFAMSGNYLMVMHDNSFHWWAVGFVKDPDSVNLPKWTGGKYKAEMPDGRVKILMDKGSVVSSCGDILTLQDGTKAKNLLY
jgi:hypothetical protein